MSNKKYWFVLVICLCLGMIFSVAGFAAEKAGGNFSDTSGHWAQGVIDNWAEKGLVGGYADGSFQPNSNITRAEFCAIVNRALGYREMVSVEFADIKTTDWYYGEIAKAVQAGYLNGYQDGTIRPGNKITRQEAAAIIYRIIKLTGDEGAVESCTDAQNIPAWSKASVGAVFKSGYMKGYPDGSFLPENDITRAESVATLDRVVGSRYSESGTYGPDSGMKTIDANVTVTAGDITLQNMTVNGVLHLTAGIGDGSVLLKNVKVTGTAVIRGGGEHSVTLDEDTVINQMVVDRREGKVRVVVLGDSTVDVVILQSAANLEQPEVVTNAFGEVVVQVPEGTVVDLSGGCTVLKVESAGVILNVVSGTTIETLELSEAATGTSVNLEEGSSVTALEINASADITGEGTITTAEINVSGAVIEQTPENVTVAEGTTSTVGGEEITGGETEEEPAGGGGGSLPQVSVTGIEASFSDKANLADNDAPFVFDITSETSYPDKTLFTGVVVKGTNVNGGTLVITQLNIANQDWLKTSIDAVISADGEVTTKQLLNELDTGALGVNLGSLREFGQQMVLTGYVTKSGCKASPEIIVTLRFSAYGPTDLSEVQNQWLDFEKSGLTITGVIKEGMEDTPLNDVEVFSFMWQGEVSTDGGITWADTETEIKAALGWDTDTLSDLVGKTIKYKNADGKIYDLKIEI